MRRSVAGAGGWAANVALPAIGALATLGAPATAATTLQDALNAAYANNPTLTGERAGLRATDEDAAIARAAGRPQLDVEGNYTQGLEGLRAVNGYNRALTGGVSAALPVFQGGRVRNGVNAADQRSAAGRETLLAVEGDIFVQTVAAYMAVRRDREIVRLQALNVDALGQDAAASDARFRGGDLTRTDVDQSASRLLVGRTQLALARATLVRSEQTYRRLTGLFPAELDPPPPLPDLPANPDEAEAQAVANNPNVRAAAAVIEATRFDVRVAEGARLPTVQGSAGYNYFNYRDRFAGIGDASGGSALVGVTVSLPIYQGGVISARVRQARDLVEQAIERRTEAERLAAADARASFASYATVADNIRLNEETVRVNERALAGVRIETKAGLRQVLDVLNAQLELVNSQVALAGARTDAYVAGFQRLNALGYANYRHLGLEGGALYDPSINFDRARRSFTDFDDGRRPQAVANRFGPPAPTRPR